MALIYKSGGEEHWTDKFGEHFEVWKLAYGMKFCRKIARDPVVGWTVTWDEARKSVDDAIDEYAKAKR